MVTACLHGGQIYSTSRGTLSLQYSMPLADECLLTLPLFLGVDKKGEGFLLLWGEGKMHSDRVRTNDQRTGPHNMSEVQADDLIHTPKGLDHSPAYHLQIGYPWHDPLSPDHMIGQEELVTPKGRAEPMFPERGGVLLYQRMQQSGTWG